MFSKADMKLVPGEEILCKAHVSWVAYLYALILFAGLFITGNLSGLIATDLVLTNKRLIGKNGLVIGKNINVPHADISLVRVSRGLFGKLCDFGTITIITKNGGKFVFKGIATPLYIQQQIEEASEIAVLGHRLSDFIEEKGESIEEKDEPVTKW